MKIRITMTAPILLAGLAMQALAQPALPTIDELIERNVRALGGRAALERAGTLVFTGRCEASNPEESGPVEIAIRSPKVAFRLGKNAGLRMWFDGDQVWRSEGGAAAQKLPTRQFASVVAVFDEARVLHWKETFPAIEPVRITAVDGREAYLLEAQPGQPSTERIYLDRESARVIRAEVLPGLAFTFSDYRPVDGLQVPFHMQQTTPAGDVYKFEFDEVRRTGDNDDSRFRPQ